MLVDGRDRLLRGVLIAAGGDCAVDVDTGVEVDLNYILDLV